MARDVIAICKIYITRIFERNLALADRQIKAALFSLFFSLCIIHPWIYCNSSSRFERRAVERIL